ncbi:MAG: hypothetical protein D6798_01145 [Deltaproteobacteria bacterium]|nr:MAG: hypothetical protein D6798_01145 [Deltaproteobacteria bacterium]
MMTTGSELPTSDRFGAYRLTRVVAEAGGAAEYEAVSVGGVANGGVAGEPVDRWSITVVRPADQAAGRVLRDVARRQQGLDHPVLCPVREVIEDQGWVGLVCEQPVGVALADLLRDGEGIEAEEVRDVLAQLVDGLAAMHRAGLAHGLLEPGRIWLVDGPTGVAVRLSGLGLAASLAAHAPGDEGRSWPRRSRPFLAPELLDGRAAPSPSTDVYALGALLAAMLRVESPPGEPAARTSPGGRRVGAPPDLAELIDACLAGDPVARPRDAGVLAGRWGRDPADAARVDEPVVVEQGALRAAAGGRAPRRLIRPLSVAAASPSPSADETPQTAGPEPGEWEGEEPTEPGVAVGRTPRAAGGAVAASPGQALPRGDMPAALAEVRARLAARDAARDGSGSGSQGRRRSPRGGAGGPQGRRARLLLALLVVAGLAAGGARLILPSGADPGRVGDGAQRSAVARPEAVRPVHGG